VSLPLARFREDRTLTIQTYGPTSRIMNRSSSGEVMSTDTQRLVFFSRIIERSRFVNAFLVVEASCSYEAI